MIYRILGLCLLVSVYSCNDLWETANDYMNKSSFERLVERFESAERDAYQKPDEVMAYLGDLTDQKIIDIGAGTGYFAVRMAQAGAQVIAADVDQRFLDYISERKKTLRLKQDIELRKVPYDSPNLKDAEVDKAIIVNTYHHIGDREDYFSKVKKGLKPEGELIVIDFFNRKQKHGPPKRHTVSAEDVVKELREAGFTEFKKEMDMLEYQYIIVAK